jgi:hypothetical protein
MLDIKYNEKTRVFSKFFLIFCFFPFFSPIPLATDTQPIAGILGLLVIFSNGRLSKRDLILLFVGLISLVYINYSEIVPSDFFHPSYIMWLYAMIVLVASLHAIKHLTASLFNTVIFIYFLASVLFILFPSEMIALQSHVVRGVNNTSIYSYRGISPLATEPGLLAGLLASFLIINDYLLDANDNTKARYYINLSLILFVLICTKSASSIVFLLFYFLTVLKPSKKTILIILLFCFILCLSFWYLPSDFTKYDRSIRIIHRVSSGTIDQDTSTFDRFYSLYIGLKSIFHYPFGVGNNLTAIRIAISSLIHGSPAALEFFKTYSGNTTAINSALGNLFVSFGIFGYISIYFIYGRFFRSVSLSVRLFSLLYLVSSFSAAFPMTWLVLTVGQAKYEKNRKKIKKNLNINYEYLKIH